MGINPIIKNIVDKQPQIKSIQVNVKHSKATTANLVKIIEEDKTDIICIQEPYTFQSKAAGILKNTKPSLQAKEDAGQPLWRQTTR
jgi:endonuclease/exonuclease/phosphatase (EEP) superfamily protein YafD